jgi:hypothetical protein
MSPHVVIINLAIEILKMTDPVPSGQLSTYLLLVA